MRARITDELLDRVHWTGNAPQGYIWDDELPGFLVVIGSTGQTFSVNWKVGKGKSRTTHRKAIGRRGQPLPSGEPLTAERARAIARAMLAAAAEPTHCPTCGQRLKRKR